MGVRNPVDELPDNTDEDKTAGLVALVEGEEEMAANDERAVI
jgi:hypothetical protein